MQSIAMPGILDALSAAERRALLSDPAMATLQGVFGAVPDPRGRRGRRYDLPFLLTCLVAALLCNGDSTLAVEQWCEEHQPLLRQVFGPLRYLTPSG
ncbi:MAG: transposase family protein, partial [Chloroflexota bacterium]